MVDFSKTQPGLRYLMNLQEKIQSTTIGYTPQNDPPKKNETVISASIPDDLKRLWILSMQLMVDAVKLQADKQLNNNISSTEIDKKRVTSEVLTEIFWAALRAEYNSYGREIGIRENWQVVEFDMDHKSQLLKFLKGKGFMLGGDMENPFGDDSQG
jgi:hypothetical protein